MIGGQIVLVPLVLLPLGVLFDLLGDPLKKTQSEYAGLK